MNQETQELIAATARAVALEISKQQLESMPLEDMAAQHGISRSTMYLAMQDGKGPRTFNIGRSVYVLREDWNAWQRRLAQSGGLKNLTPPRRPKDLDQAA